MTNEEMERAVELVVKQRAQFAADPQKLGHAHGETEKTLGTVVGLLGQVAETQVQMAEAPARTDSRIADLAQLQKRTDEALAPTNERLKSLLVVAERYFSNGNDARH